MSARILVGYATRNGSTAEIAEAMGKELQSTGQNVIVKRLGDVTSVEGYDAIVIGAPIYMGKVIGVAKFVGRFKGELSTRPFAAYAVGIAPASKDEKKMDECRKALQAAIAPLQPVTSALFAGSLDPAKLSFIQRKMTEFVKSPVGDFRDWDAISGWARELPGKMGVQ